MASDRRDQQPGSSLATFDAAAANFLASAQARESAALTSSDYQTVLSTLTRFSQRLGLERTEAEELVLDCVAEILDQIKEGRITDVRQPGALMVWKTRKRVLDRHRHSKARRKALDQLEAEHPVRYYSEHDENIVRLLEGSASAAVVEDALRAALAAGDFKVVRVVTEWLRLAEETGETPTSREVAPHAELSHTSVSQALQRFRAFISRVDQPGFEAG